MESFDMRNISLKAFFEAVESCKGAVFMISPEGDRLNLKSALCRIIGWTKLVEGGVLSKVRIECSDKEDERKLFRFNLFGGKGTSGDDDQKAE
jgi:PAS domain-containing protein